MKVAELVTGDMRILMQNRHATSGPFIKGPDRGQTTFTVSGLRVFDGKAIGYLG